MARDPLTFVMGEDVILARLRRDSRAAQEVRSQPRAQHANFGGRASSARRWARRWPGRGRFARSSSRASSTARWTRCVTRRPSCVTCRAARPGMPITFRAVYGAVGGAAAQHSETVYAQFLSVPGLKLAMPSSPSDIKGILKSAIRDDNPVIVFEHCVARTPARGNARRRSSGSARQGRDQARGQTT